MNLKLIGRKIKNLREDANLTQRELAEMLSITDKAVSKWERGIGLPETSILHKMSKIFDADLDFILGPETDVNNKWSGLIIYNNGITFNKKTYDKPLLFYLLHYFMLTGIKNISFVTNDVNRKIVESYNLNKYGLNLDFNKNKYYNKTMIIFEPIFLFGANLTRYFESCMCSDKDYYLTCNKKKLPIVFINSKNNINKVFKFEKCNLTRGMIYIPLNSNKNFKKASEFVGVYQSTQNLKIADLDEIFIKLLQMF